MMNDFTSVQQYIHFFALRTSLLTHQGTVATFHR